jgi:hypothetical protein
MRDAVLGATNLTPPEACRATGTPAEMMTGLNRPLINLYRMDKLRIPARQSNARARYPPVSRGRNSQVF